MKEKVICALIGLSLFAGWMGYKIWYLNSDSYRARFAVRFERLKVNDSYEQMISLIGRAPTHYCDVEVMPEVLSDPKQEYREFIYRIGDTDFTARFPYLGVASYGGMVEKKGPVTRRGCAAEWSK